MVSIFIFGGLNLFIVAYCGLRDSKTHRWRKMENRSDLIGYVALHISTLLGGISMIFVEPRIAELMGC